MENKRIAKFNVVDIIAVVLILLVVAFAGWKLLGGDEAPVDGKEDIAVDGTVKLTYVVRAEKVPAELYEAVLAHVPSQLSAGGKMVDGQITAVEKKPYYVAGADGQWLEDPDHVNLYFTVETQVDAKEVMTNAVGTQEVRIGKSHILKTEYLEFPTTVIVDAKWGE